MKKKTAGKTSMKKRLLIPIAVAAGMMMTVPAFAQHIYIGDTETVISYDENGNKVITLIFDPAKTPDYMKPESPNYWRKAEQAQSQAQAEHMVQMPVEQSADFMAQAEVVYTAQPENETLLKPIEPQLQPVPPLTEAPEVGTVLADIHHVDEDGEIKLTKQYDSFSVGQCTWYVRGRVREVYGIELPYMGRAGIWADESKNNPAVEVITDLSDVPEQAIAVYEASAEFKGWPGHVSFVEYVERDKYGNPVTVYYTDANGAGDPEKNAYTPGYDGSVKAVSYEKFLKPYGIELVGYILPK